MSMSSSSPAICSIPADALPELNATGQIDAVLSAWIPIDESTAL